jgi:DNA-binding MarR family transcriptional regulator
MEDLTEHEKAVLRALSELEPATLEEIAVRTGLPAARVKEILDGLAKRELLTTLDKLA